jgi:hypothetical protein
MGGARDVALDKNPSAAKSYLNPACYFLHDKGLEQSPAISGRRS